MVNEQTHDLLDSRRQRVDALAQIVTDRRALVRVVEKNGQSLRDGPGSD
jgi:hypothetical protein